jgi:Dioxygenases related to 2-nitropropane dioxygenase
MGFLPRYVYQEQVKAVIANRPHFVLIAGGTAEQAKALEQVGIATYLHVPSPGLLQMFLDAGLKRFIFEGRECGGHIGPLSSFVFWELMIERLLKFFSPANLPAEYQILFAGGIHDAVSAAMVGVMSASLAKRGVRIGLQLGTVYLFTEEAVESGAIVRDYQQSVIGNNSLAVLETGPGHAFRCLSNVFTKEFNQKRSELLSQGVPGKEISAELERMVAGRGIIAAKGLKILNLIEDQNPEVAKVSEEEQISQGLYLTGQVAVLRDRAARR